jgi:hypothetical protein
VQLGPAFRALVEPPQRQTQLRQRNTALPTNKAVTHDSSLPLAPGPRRGAPSTCPLALGTA